MRVITITLFLLGSVFVCGHSLGQTGWRGDGSGVYPGSNPPLSWSTTKNVLWETPMEAESNATPVVVGDQVFVTAEPRTIIALNREDGRVMWKREVTFADSCSPDRREKLIEKTAEAEALRLRLVGQEQALNILKAKVRRAKADAELITALKEQSQRVNELTVSLKALEEFQAPELLPVVGSASSTPVASADAVFAVFGNGVVAKLNFSGDVLWARFLGKPVQRMFGYFRGQAASLRLVGARLIVPLNHLYALSAEDGSVLWKSEVYQDFGTPVVVAVGQDHVVITPSGVAVDVKDGAVLGRDLARTFYSSPIKADSRVYFVGAIEDHSLERHYAAVEIVTGAKSRPVVRQLWNTRIDLGSNHASPLRVGDLIYSVDKDGRLMIFSAHDAKLLSKKVLPEKLSPIEQYYPSPAYAGGHLFITNNQGRTGVFKPGLDYELVGFNDLKPMRSSLTFVGDRIYVRALESVFCLSERELTP